MTMEAGGGKILMHKYEIGRLLGKGTFAKVYYARNIVTSESVAIKVIDKDKILKVGLIDQIQREISVMKMVRHPMVVQLHEVMATKSKIYFVLEYVKGGELFRRVVKGRLKEDVARKYFLQLITALRFCHSRGVYHRDLKPENLLLDEDGNLKISDFGLSALVGSKRKDGLLHTSCGTPAYTAPEVICRKGYDGVKADIWSCGVILFVLMAGYLPFQDPNLMEMYRKIAKAEFKCPSWFPSDLHKLLTRMLDPNPNTRISISKVMESHWFKRGPSGKHFTRNLQDKKNDLTVEEKQEFVKLANLNAFDIISLSTGFDLSGLFESDLRREARFSSSKPASAIMSKMEEVAKCLNLQVKKKDRGILNMETAREGRRGVVSMDFEIFEVAPSLHLVEIKKNSGDALEFEKMLANDIRPALAEIDHA